MKPGNLIASLLVKKGAKSCGIIREMRNFLTKIRSTWNFQVLFYFKKG